MRKIGVVACLTGLLNVGIGAAGASEVLVIKNGRVLPMNGPAIEGGVVIVENGKIARVGKDIPVPEGATVIDAAGGWVLPGLIEAHTTIGLREEYGPSNSDELSDPVTAQLVVLDALNPFDNSLKHAREAGITANTWDRQTAGIRIKR
jgi:imidazolonepropionase-like amidohydrolase